MRYHLGVTSMSVMHQSVAVGKKTTQLSQMRGYADKIPRQQVEDGPEVMIGTPLFRE